MSDHSTSTSATFTGPGAADAGEVSLILEQRAFPQDSGDVKSIEEIAEDNDLEFIEMHNDSMGGQVAFSSNTDEINELYQAQCGKNPDGSITATVYVYTTPNFLSYNLVASWGEFEGDPVTESIAKEESINFTLSQTVELDYSVEEIVSIEWDGDVYNASGGIIQVEVPILSGTTLTASQAVYGTIRINYTVLGDTWLLNIPPRESTQNTFQSTVHAFYGDNQVETIEIDPPNLLDLCDQRVTWSLNADEEQPADGEGEGDGTSVALQLTAYNYCSGEVISGATFYIGGKQVPASGHTVKRGVTYSIVTKASGYRDFTNTFSV